MRFRCCSKFGLTNEKGNVQWTNAFNHNQWSECCSLLKNNRVHLDESQHNGGTSLSVRFCTFQCTFFFSKKKKKKNWHCGIFTQNQRAIVDHQPQENTVFQLRGIESDSNVYQTMLCSVHAVCPTLRGNAVCAALAHCRKKTTKEQHGFFLSSL